MRYESCVTSLSWIPSEAVTGGTRTAFDAGFTHYDDPPPDVLGDIEELRAADRFRFANVLKAWIDVDDAGQITGSGYDADSHGQAGSTTVRLALAALIARVIARMALAALGLSGDPVHEPVHPRPLRPWILLLRVNVSGVFDSRPQADTAPGPTADLYAATRRARPSAGARICRIAVCHCGASREGAKFRPVRS